MNDQNSKKPDQTIGIIPARMASTRFPGKPMAEICGIPMVGHVLFRSRMSAVLDNVFVATCDPEIFDYVGTVGGKAVMTADTHVRASDRTAEAMLEIEASTGTNAAVVVMIQGDEPMIHPGMIDEAVRPMKEDGMVGVVNLMARLKTREDQDDPNVVKVVVESFNNALYFSREPIPSRKKAKDGIAVSFKQVAVIPFGREALLTFNLLRPTPLEIIESVDMLRLLEHGYKVKMVPTEFETYSVDTPADLKRVEAIMAGDPLFQAYRKRT